MRECQNTGSTMSGVIYSKKPVLATTVHESLAPATQKNLPKPTVLTPTLLPNALVHWSGQLLLVLSNILSAALRVSRLEASVEIVNWCTRKRQGESSRSDYEDDGPKGARRCHGTLSAVTRL